MSVWVFILVVHLYTGKLAGYINNNSNPWHWCFRVAPQYMGWKDSSWWLNQFKFCCFFFYSVSSPFTVIFLNHSITEPTFSNSCKKAPPGGTPKVLKPKGAVKWSVGLFIYLFIYLSIFLFVKTEFFLFSFSLNSALPRKQVIWCEQEVSNVLVAI